MTSDSSAIPVLGFAAYSGTGKTTLLEKLIPQLTQSGLRIALIKHAHHQFDIDHPSKDSYRFRKAGARQVLVSSRYRHALITETPNDESPFTSLLNQIDKKTIDCILVEGFKQESIPKIELHRDATGAPWLFPEDENIIAVASDSASILPSQCALPLLNLNNEIDIARFILNWLSQQHHHPVSCETNSSTLLSVDEAKKRILSQIPLPQSQQIYTLTQSRGAVLAESIYSSIDVPPSNNAAMDGFAIRGEDIKLNQFHIVGEIRAGYKNTYQLSQGECIRIMTGAPLPINADTVVIREQVSEHDDHIDIHHEKGAIKLGQHVRQRGEDLEKGAALFQQGKRMNAVGIGMLASIGIEKISVFSPIIVAVFSTGDEVTPLEMRGKTSEKIYDTNRFALQALLQKLGCEILDLGIIPDDASALRNTLSYAQLHADMIISSGGVSVGTADYIKSVLAQLGDIDFWRVNMRPGRPLAFGQLNEIPFFGLPGNPVAVMVTFLEFVEPAIRQRQGEKNWQPLAFTATAIESFRSRIGRTEYIRGIYSHSETGQLEVKATGTQGSGILRSMDEANCLIKIAPSVQYIKIGESVRIMPLAGRL